DYGDRDRHPGNLQIPGVLIVRCESSLYYFNVEHVRDRIAELLESRPDPVHLIEFDMGTSPRVDFAGAGFLRDLQRTFSARGIEFRLAEPNGWVRDALRRADYGPFGDQTVSAAILSWRAPRTIQDQEPTATSR